MFPLINFLEVVEDHLEIETQEDIMHVFYVLRQPLQTLFHIKSYGLLQLFSVPSPPFFIQLKNLFKHDFDFLKWRVQLNLGVMKLDIHLD